MYIYFSNKTLVNGADEEGGGENPVKRSPYQLPSTSSFRHQQDTISGSQEVSRLRFSVVPQSSRNRAVGANSKQYQGSALTVPPIYFPRHYLHSIEQKAEVKASSDQPSAAVLIDNSESVTSRGHSYRVTQKSHSHEYVTSTHSKHSDEKEPQHVYESDTNIHDHEPAVLQPTAKKPKKTSKESVKYVYHYATIEVPVFPALGFKRFKVGQPIVLNSKLLNQVHLSHQFQHYKPYKSSSSKSKWRPIYPKRNHYERPSTILNLYLDEPHNYYFKRGTAGETSAVESLGKQEPESTEETQQQQEKQQQEAKEPVS
ncbi:unnamed protein product [Notodromas monacha]|uniref:Uncharacterized protein n=1 Tax=Notodromas monacha TaxID=399045 RepID=A0A7R9GH94_9CRUS|nr:unnamed protein product [Notodromas monacha]CAG0921074.1 unnamed protein product [Notodromas monacha]